MQATLEADTLERDNEAVDWNFQAAGMIQTLAGAPSARQDCTEEAHVDVKTEDEDL